MQLRYGLDGKPPLSRHEVFNSLFLNSICHNTICALIQAHYPITQLGYNAEHEPLLSLMKNENKLLI